MIIFDSMVEPICTMAEVPLLSQRMTDFLSGIVS
jgi:hypothetical protein